jgi:SAM-dependent methyltransferase
VVGAVPAAPPFLDVREAVEALGELAEMNVRVGCRSPRGRRGRAGRGGRERAAIVASVAGRTTRVELPPRALVPKPADEDPVDYYYKPFTAWLYRSRLRIAADLLGPGPYESLLEVGYGSGIFLPELARRTRRLSAVDLHEEAAPVAAMLRAVGVEAELDSGSILALPYEDAAFDAVVCVSVLEHLRQLDEALAELRRVLRPAGVAILGFPGRNPITDAFFRIVGYDPREIHPSGHRDILAAAYRQPNLVPERVVRFPSPLPLSLAAYVGCRARAT